MAAVALSLLLLAAADGPASTRQWYGRENLAWDLAAYTSVAVGALGKPQRPFFSAIGLSLYALGGPTSHLMHGNPGRAAGSLGLRVALPIALGFGLAETCSDTGTAPMANSCVWNSGLGFLLGATIATAIDASALAYETRAPESLGLQPTVSVTKHGGTLGVGGVF